MKKKKINPERESTVAMIKGINERIRLLEQRIERLKEKRVKVRKNCKHDGETRFYGDPSGNNDSYTECKLCGAYI